PNLDRHRPGPDWDRGAEEGGERSPAGGGWRSVRYGGVLPRHLENLVHLAGEHPGLTFVLDHLGKPPVGLAEDYRRWEEQITQVAACPNVVAKVSGIYRADAPAAVSADQLEAVLSTALAAFGSQRLMLGSDWPVCTVYGGTAATMSTLAAAVDRLPAEQAQHLRHETATRTYALEH